MPDPFEDPPRSQAQRVLLIIAIVVAVLVLMAMSYFSADAQSHKLVDPASDGTSQSLGLYSPL